MKENEKTTARPEADAVVLFSGGLDSILAAKLLEEQGLRVRCLHFYSPFFGDPAAVGYWQRTYRLEIEAIDVGEDFCDLLRRRPEHQFGKVLNPCMDCKILLLRHARRHMERLGARVIATGEVLGQRPMSQRRDALNVIRRDADGKLKVIPYHEAFPQQIEQAASLLEQAAALAEDAPAFLLLLEPADRAAAPRLHALRRRLPDLPLYAPCPHGGPCPMLPDRDGICHDVRRFRPGRPMTLLLRRLRRTVSDVKYALLAFGRPGGPQADGFGDPEFLRMAGPMDKAKGILTCRACMGDGTLLRVELPAAALPTPRRHALLDRQRGDCAWLDGPTDIRRRVSGGTVQRTADLRFADEPPPTLDDLDGFSFSI